MRVHRVRAQLATSLRRNKSEKSSDSVAKGAAPNLEDSAGAYRAPMPSKPKARPQARPGVVPPRPKAKPRPSQAKPSASPRHAATPPSRTPNARPPLVPKEPPYPPPHVASAESVASPLPSEAMKAGMRVLFTPKTQITAEQRFAPLSAMKDKVQALATSTTCRHVPVDDLNFTQSSCGDRFTDGKSFLELLNGLLSKKIKLSEPFLQLSCVETSAGISSFNNRRLFVLKQYQRLVSFPVKVSCKIHALDPVLESFVEMCFDGRRTKKHLATQLALVKDIMRHRDNHFSKDIRVRYKS